MQQIEDHEFEAVMWKTEDIDDIIAMIREMRGDKRPRRVAEPTEKQKLPSLQDLGFKPKANIGIMRR